MKLYKPLFLSLLLLTTCKNASDTKTQSNALGEIENSVTTSTYTFNHPNDWKITDNEALDEGIHFLSIEKKGFDSSGIVTIVSYEELLDLDDLIHMNIEEIESNSLISNLSFKPIANNKFNTIDSRATSFQFSIMGIQHEGAIHAFNNKSSSYVLMQQEALEDKEKNALGFNAIEDSFSIE